MHYQGGKAPESRFIGPFLNKIRKPGQPYWEPFVGAASVLARITGDGPHYASDTHPELIAMWQALQAGWVPPEDVSEDEYHAARAGGCPPALTAFIGFGCGWGGKYFGGYARSRAWESAPGMAYRSVLKKISTIPRDTVFFCRDYREWLPVRPALIYADPPYEGRTGFKGQKKFDHEEFWEWCRVRTAEDHTVCVSSFQAPPDFIPALEISAATETKGKGVRHKEVELVLIHESSWYFNDPVFD